MSLILEQQVTILNKEVTGLRKELHDTQKEISQVLGELQNVIQSLAAMSASAIDGVNARLSVLESPVTALLEGTEVRKEVKSDSGVEL